MGQLASQEKVLDAKVVFYLARTRQQNEVDNLPGYWIERNGFASTLDLCCVFLAEMPCASNVGIKQGGRFPEKIFITFQTFVE